MIWNSKEVKLWFRDSLFICHNSFHFRAVQQKFQNYFGAISGSGTLPPPPVHEIPCPPLHRIMLVKWFWKNVEFKMLNVECQNINDSQMRMCQIERKSWTLLLQISLIYSDFFTDKWISRCWNYTVSTQIHTPHDFCYNNDVSSLEILLMTKRKISIVKILHCSNIFFIYRVLLSLIGFAILLGTVYDVFIYQPSVENARSSLLTVAGKHRNL